jgi:hypothetical protein
MRPRVCWIRRPTSRCWIARPGFKPWRNPCSSRSGGLREKEAALRALRDGVREAQRHREILEFQANEIEKAGLDPAEEETLLQDRLVQSNAARLGQLCDEAYASLYEDEDAIVSRLGQVYRKVEELAGIDRRFQPHVEARARKPRRDSRTWPCSCATIGSPSTCGRAVSTRSRAVSP